MFHVYFDKYKPSASQSFPLHIFCNIITKIFVGSNVGHDKLLLEEVSYYFKLPTLHYALKLIASK